VRETEGGVQRVAGAVRKADRATRRTEHRSAARGVCLVLDAVREVEPRLDGVTGQLLREAAVDARFVAAIEVAGTWKRCVRGRVGGGNAVAPYERRRDEYLIVLVDGRV